MRSWGNIKLTLNRHIWTGGNRCTSPGNSACSGLSEAYFSEEVGKLSETMKSIKCMLVKKWFTVHTLVTPRAWILFEKDSHAELSLEGGMTDRSKSHKLEKSHFLIYWHMLSRNLCSQEILIGIIFYSVFISNFQKQMLETHMVEIYWRNICEG